MSDRAVKTYSVSLNGCDDYTMFDMDLTDTEAHFLGRVADLMVSSGWQPYSLCCFDSHRAGRRTPTGRVDSNRRIRRKGRGVMSRSNV